MRLLAPVALLLVLLAACANDQAPEAEDAHQAQVASEMNHYDVEEKRYPSCVNAPAGSTCGLLFAQVSIDTYKVKACGLAPDDVVDDVCEKQFVATFYKQLRARYPYADWQRVEASCRGDADRCVSLRNVELALLQTHNANAQRRHDDAMAGLETKPATNDDDALVDFLLSPANGDAAMHAAQASQAAAMAGQQVAPPPMPPPMFLH